jgi:hypothetical protein
MALFTPWGELFLALWLLMKGVNVEQWENVLVNLSDVIPNLPA